jgi:integrase
MKLTQNALAKIKIPAGKTEHIEFDDGLHGFGLRLRSTGARTWIVQYKIGPQHRRLTLGSTAMLTADQARNGWKDQEGNRHDGAAIILANAKQGADAANQRAEARGHAAKTIGNIVAAYLEAKKSELRPRGYQGTEYHLNTLWKPLHKLAVSAVTRAAIAAQVRAIAKENGVVSANRARGTLHAMFTWAIGEGLCDANPVLGTNKQKENDPRDRVLSDQEAATVWLAAGPDSDYGRIVRLLMLTGCRRDEIGSLKWKEIDLEARTITLPSERTKNAQAHTIPLSDSAMTVIGAIPRRNREHVFGEATGGYAGWSRSKTRLDGRAKLKQPWTLHDIRRTVRTGLSGLDGVSPWVAEAILNHLPPKLVRTYAVSDTGTNFAKKLDADKRAALDLWASHLAVAVAQAGGANVTRLQSRK